MFLVIQRHQVTGDINMERIYVNKICRSVRPSKINREMIYLALVMMAGVIDFRRAEGGGSVLVQMIGALSVIVFGTLLVVKYQNRIGSVNLLLPIGLIFFGGWAATVGFFRGQEIYFLFVNNIPFINFFFCAVVVGVCGGGEGTNKFISTIIFISILGVLWKLYFGFSYNGLTLEDVRYQIISAAIPLLFGYFFASLVSYRAPYAILSFLLCVTVLLLAVTRTYVLVVGVQFIIAIYIGKKIPQRLYLGGFRSGGAGVLVLGVIALFLIFPDVVGRWVLRFTQSDVFGFDLTAASRGAQNFYMIDKILSNPVDGLLGFGLLGESGFSGTQLDLIVSVFGNSAAEYQAYGFGHNTYISMFYLGGLVVGGGFVFLMFWDLLINIGTAKKYCKDKFCSPQTQFISLWSASACSGYAVYGMLSGTFGDRSMGIFYGIAVGLGILAKRLKSEAISVGS